MFTVNKEMKQFVLLHFDKTWIEISKLFNEQFNIDCSFELLRKKMNAAGIKKGRSANAGSFKKGQASWNKGLKGYCPSPETLWKKGNIPHTAKPVGYERINKDGHIECKVENRNQMVLKHHHIWKKHKGEIPKNHVIMFKDNDKSNCDIDNLILVSRAELARFNQNYAKLSTSENHESLILLAKIKNITIKRK